MLAELFPPTVKPHQLKYITCIEPGFRDVHSTVGFGWCFWEEIHFGLSQGNDSFFYGQTLITKSVRESIWEEAQKQTSCISEVNTSSVPFFSKHSEHSFIRTYEETVGVQKNR